MKYALILIMIWFIISPQYPGNTQPVKYDTVKCVIEPDEIQILKEELKELDAELEKEISDKKNDSPTKVVVKTKYKLNPVEKVYIRVEGVVYEYDIKREGSFLIIDVDSIYKDILSNEIEEPSERNNFFKRLFYRKINK